MGSTQRRCQITLRGSPSYNDKTKSETHDTFKCKRCRDGKQILKAAAMLYGDTSTCVAMRPDAELMRADGTISATRSWPRFTT